MPALSGDVSDSVAVGERLREVRHGAHLVSRAMSLGFVLSIPSSVGAVWLDVAKDRAGCSKHGHRRLNVGLSCFQPRFVSSGSGWWPETSA
jgi:hypothetical protein